MIRSVKSTLRKTIGLSKIELETTLQEVEAGVNSKPLLEMNLMFQVLLLLHTLSLDIKLQFEISDQPSYVNGKDLIVR